MTEPDDEPTPDGHDLLALVSAVQDWAARTFAPTAEGHTGCEYQWCPICQVVSVLRGDRPEVNEQVAQAGAAVMSAFHAFLDATKPAPDDAAGARVQHINLDDDTTPGPGEA